MGSVAMVRELIQVMVVEFVGLVLQWSLAPCHLSFRSWPLGLMDSPTVLFFLNESLSLI